MGHGPSGAGICYEFNTYESLSRSEKRSYNSMPEEGEDREIFLSLNKLGREIFLQLPPNQKQAFMKLDADNRIKFLQMSDNFKLKYLGCSEEQRQEFLNADDYVRKNFGYYWCLILSQKTSKELDSLLERTRSNEVAITDLRERMTNVEERTDNVERRMTNVEESHEELSEKTENMENFLKKKLNYQKVVEEEAPPQQFSDREEVTLF